MMTSRPFLVVTGAALFLASCAGDLDGADEYEALPVSSAIRPANVFAPAPGAGPVMVTGESCDRAVTLLQMEGACGGVGACHGTADSPPMLPVADFSGDPALLPGKLKAATGLVACTTTTVLDATNPAQSLLITKLNDDPPCGDKMPLAGTITEEDKLCIANWAQAAAASTQ